VIGIVVCLMGIAIFLVSLEDLSPVFSGDKPPAILVSAIVSMGILALQYFAGLIAAGFGMVGTGGAFSKVSQNEPN
jgi:hypothetical protein